MGMRTTLYGYIEEMDFWLDPIKKRVRKHNSSVIRSLPIADPWPPLSREMFAICTNYKDQSGPMLDYSGRIIHFGANLKSFDHEWREWKPKFERLLNGLYFLEAKVHVQTEYMPYTTSQWRVNLLKYKVVHDGTMPTLIKPEYIDYEASPLDEMFD